MQTPNNQNQANNNQQHLQQQHSRNIDYEIVVMLEGNIETTGASCHIRTSYLPQEILFGYRFKPIFPKINKFEYMFDFSKFDNVELVQPHLVHLNVASHVNKIIYDAKREHKNCQLTFQNTINGDTRFPFAASATSAAAAAATASVSAANPRSLQNFLNVFEEHQAVKFYLIKKHKNIF